MSATIRNRRRRMPAILLVALLLGLLGTGVAQAKTFDVAYDWSDARYGFAGWQPDNTPPGGSAGGPWYTATGVPGEGLRIVPTGGGGLPYRDARGTWAWDPPGGASIRRVRLEGVSGTSILRQFGRVWLIVAGEPPDARSNQFELGHQGAPGPQPSATWTNRAFTLTTPLGRQGVGFVLWLFTIPCESVEEPASCVNVTPADGAAMSIRKAVFTVDDPSKPDLDVTGLSDGTVWTSSRQVPLHVAVGDAQSGVARIDATVRGGGSTKSINLGRWATDRFAAAPRPSGVPPLAVAQQADRTVTVAREGTSRITVETVNGAGMKTTRTGRISVDRDRPNVGWPGAVRPGASVRATDGPSGVQTAVLKVDGRERDRCGGGRACRLQVPRDIADRARVAVEVVDRAGNQRSRTRSARVAGVASDHRKPKIVWPRSVKVGATVQVTDADSGLADATLTVAGADDPVARCGGGQKRCRLRIPEEGSGKQIRIAGADRAGNRVAASRRVLRRACRPRSTCATVPAPKASFLVYPVPDADLWAGPLRFRWARPTIKGVKPSEALWYRVALDGEEVYSGAGLEHDEFGIEIAEHRWQVGVYRSRQSHKRLKLETRRFQMTPYRTGAGGPTDTDTNDEDAGTVGRAGGGMSRAVGSAPGEIRANTATEGDLIRRFAPAIYMDGGERWRPINVDFFLQESKQLLCTLRGSTRRCDSRERTTLLADESRGGKYFDIGTPGTSDDDTYKVARDCGARGKTNQGYECDGSQPIYYAGRYSSEHGLYALEYWFFYRYNDGNSKDCGGILDFACKALGEAVEVSSDKKRFGDHEGDWEGVTVYVDRDGKRVRDVVFHQHSSLVHYSRSRLRFVKGTSRVQVFPAKGRHSTYPAAGNGVDVHDVGGVSGWARDQGEVYDGKIAWEGNGRDPTRCKNGGACVLRFGVRRRTTMNQALVPEGPWASYPGAWGGSLSKVLSPAGQGDSPYGPGIGANSSSFRRPFDFGRLSSGRAAGAGAGIGQAGDAKAPCSSWFGGGVTALACGLGDGGGVTLTVAPRNGPEETVQSEETPLGVGWVAQRVGVAPAIGDVVRLRDPAGTTRELSLRVAGRYGQPYVARFTIDGAAGAGTADLQIVDAGAAGIALTGVPAGWHTRIVPGPSLSGGPSVHLFVDDRSSAGSLWFGNAHVRRLRLSAITRTGARRRVQVRSSSGARRSDGYEQWRLGLPKTTRFVVGKVWVSGRTKPVDLEVQANLPIFEPRTPPSDTAPGPGVPDGTGRPTGG